MLSEANTTYYNLTQAEIDQQFNQELEKYGIATDSVKLITSLIDDVNSAKLASVEAEVKALNQTYVTAEQEAQLKLLQQKLEAGQIDIDAAKAKLTEVKTSIATSKESGESETYAIQKSTLVKQISKQQTSTLREAYIISKRSEIVSMFGETYYKKLLAQYGD
jgi:hypothetical protein